MPAPAVPVTLAGVKRRLVGLDGWLAAAATSAAAYDDNAITADLPRRVRKFEREMRIRLTQTQVVCMPDGTYTGSYGGKDLEILEEDPQPYYDADANQMLRLDLRYRPVTEVQRVRYFLGDLFLFQIPTHWIRTQRRAGSIHIIPTTGSVATAGIDLGFNILNRLTGGRGPQDHMPDSIAVDFVAGLKDGWENTNEWADLPMMLENYCAMGVLEDIRELYDAGTVSVQLSADGLSQGIQLGRFNERIAQLDARIEKYKKDLAGDQVPFVMGSV